MGGPGVPTSIISFISQGPSAVMGFNSLGVYERAQELGDIYDFLPHGKHFMMGLAILAHVVGTPEFPLH